jgi:hypothetical protein
VDGLLAERFFPGRLGAHGCVVMASLISVSFWSQDRALFGAWPERGVAGLFVGSLGLFVLSARVSGPQWRIWARLPGINPS